VHDFEPGIFPPISGLFWTIAVPPSAVEVNPGRGRARFRMDNVALPDFHDFFNAVGFVAPAIDTLPSHVSFDVEWKGRGDRLKVRDTDFDFGGTFVSSDATVTFSASNDGKGVTYTSVAAEQHTVSAGVGHEQNGAFFV
jgi:hypothetical protein